MLKQVTPCKYLGSVIDENGGCDKEIRAIIGMAKANFGEMRNLLASLNLDKLLRTRLLKCYVWSGLLYGCESLTISNDMQKRLEATEMWLLRTMLRVPWKARRTNLLVLRTAGTTRKQITFIRQR